MRLLLGIIFGVASLAGQGLRDWSGPAPAAKPAMACGELRALTSFDLSVISAIVVPESATAPQHCRVSLMLPPEVNVEVNLPSAWNGRLYVFGNGGWAGEPFEAQGRVATRGRGLRAGFMTAATDTGHSAALEPGASFALNRQKLLDFAFRSVHVTAEAAKLMARTYYGSAPAKSYYEGCSQGGRQGLIMAQRFPNDFDGIVAGAPALNQTGTHLARAYWMQGLHANPFPAAKLGLLAKRVYDQCDAKDGLKDGLIEDPRRCDFKAGHDLPRCAAGADQPDCFTANEIAGTGADLRRHHERRQALFPRLAGGPRSGRAEWAERLDGAADQRTERPRSLDVIRVELSDVPVAGSEGRQYRRRSGPRLRKFRYRQSIRAGWKKCTG